MLLTSQCSKAYEQMSTKIIEGDLLKDQHLFQELHQNILQSKTSSEEEKKITYAICGNIFRFVRSIVLD